MTVRESDINYNIRVTAINANHCPGSLMFLMEKLDFMGAVSKRILYTGDFRFDYSGKPLTFLKSLHSGSLPLLLTLALFRYCSLPTASLGKGAKKKTGLFSDIDQKGG